MSRSLIICLAIVSMIGLAATGLWFAGLPLRRVPPPQTGLVGAVNDSVIDPTRSEFFAKADRRVIPFQILYPASAAGQAVAYVSDAEPLTAALKRNQPLVGGLALARIGRMNAPWTTGARPLTDGPFPVVVYLPGVTGYMEMSSFQTAALAAAGFIVVTLNQPGNVAAARLPDGRVIEGMGRDEAVRLIAPSYRALPLSPTDAARLAPEQSIIPYLAADIPVVIDRLSVINADSQHLLHGMLDLQKVGIMGVSLDAIVAAQACHSYARVKACLMLDAPAPTVVSDAGLRNPALWISRPAADQRAERAAFGGWPELEIAAQADSISRAVSNSCDASVVFLPGLFHVDFTDLPTIQPLIGWFGMAGPIGTAKAHREVVSQTITFFRHLKTKRVRARSTCHAFQGRGSVMTTDPSHSR